MTKSRPLSFTLNLRPVHASVEPRRTLLDCLRNDLALTGTKRVCDMGDCGACTVLVEGIAVYSCLVLALEVEGKQVTTIEGVSGDSTSTDGLSNGNGLSALQQAFLQADAYQCGFCTPGQIMTLSALLEATPNPSDDEILRALAGNLCRCGAYQNIVKAARLAGGRDGD